MDIGSMSLLLVLPVAVAASAFMSGTETVMFGLTAEDRWEIQRAKPRTGEAIEKLLAHPRRLLLTLLMANVTVNSIWFAVTTVVITGLHLSMWIALAVGVAQVIVLIVFGEVLPKLVGNSARRRLAPIVAGPALVLCKLLTPIRAVVERVVFDPLNAISAEAALASATTPEEISEVVRAAGDRADISQEEAALIGRVVTLKRTRVRDVMTHRRQVASISHHARRDEIIAVSQRTGLKRLPVTERNLDWVMGILDVRAYLLDTRGEATPIDAHMLQPQFVPEVASMDQLLDLFKARKTSLMIVVDEHGGNAGIVALEDAVEEIVGDIAAQGESSPVEPTKMADGSWRVDGTMGAAAFCAHFRLRAALTRASTVAGIVFDELGDLPEIGTTFPLGGVSVRVGATIDGRATEVFVTAPEGKRSGARRQL